MAARIGTITGIALIPGVSRNGRLYTVESIGRAAQRAQQRIDEDGEPLTMLTHHAADDDSTKIVGRLTSVTQLEDGSAAYTADLADTDEARDIAKLVDPNKGPAYLRGVSIRGAWVGKVRRQPGPNGAQVETADDLELDGLDFTRKPGVLGARVVSFTPEAASAPAETAPEGRVLITESVQEALVTTTTEADTPAVSKRGSGLTGDGGTVYADPGYQADKKQRYDISSKAKAKAAWSYISQADNARAYTSAQLKRIKQRIIKALKKFGVTVDTQEGWLIEPATQVTEALAECWDMDRPQGSLYLSLTNGPTTVSITSSVLDAHDLDLVGRAAMAGACDALLQLDPDMDGDIDVPGAPGEDTDGDMGSGDGAATAAGAACPCGCGCAIPETPGGCPCACDAGDCLHCMGEDDDSGDMGETAPETPATETAGTALTQTPAPESPAAGHTTSPEEEPAMAEPNTPAAETAAVPAAGGVHLTDDQFAQLLARVAPAPAAPAAVESAPAETVAETTAPAAEVTETEDQKLARLVAEGVAAALPKAIQEHVEATGGPSRKGIVPQVSESTGTAGNAQGLPEGAPVKPLHEYTPEEWSQHIAPSVTGAIFQGRG